MMRDVLMDSLFWTIVMPWFLFLGLFLVPKKPSWLRNYAFSRRVFIAVGFGSGGWGGSRCGHFSASCWAWLPLPCATKSRKPAP